MPMIKKSSTLSLEAVPWIRTDGADLFFACLIVLNAIVLGVDIEIGLRNGGDSGPVLFWIQFGFLVVFVVELILRLKAQGCRFFSIWGNPAGIFDVVIVATSVAENVVSFVSEGVDSPLEAISVMRIFRLMRIARLARLLRVCPELSLLVGGLAASIQAVFWVFCLLVVIMYICALVCTMELGRTESEELRQYFGSVGSSFWTHFMVVTLEGYPSVAAAAAQESWLWYLYFVGFILFSNVVLMNLVTGIVCESIVTKAQDDETQSHVFKEESRKFEEVMLELMSLQGYGSDVELCFEDFQQLIQVTEVREALNTLAICLDIEDRAMWDILDEDGSGKLSPQLFIKSLLRLRGSKDAIHSLFVQADIIRGGRAVRETLDEAEADVSNYMSALSGALQNKLLHRISELAGQVEETYHGPLHYQPSKRKKQRPQVVLQSEATHGAAPEEAIAATGGSQEGPAATGGCQDVRGPWSRSQSAEEGTLGEKGQDAGMYLAMQEPLPAPTPSRGSHVEEDASNLPDTSALSKGAVKLEATVAQKSTGLGIEVLGPEVTPLPTSPSAAGSSGRVALEVPAEQGQTSVEERVLGVLAELETSSTQARQTLTRLGKDLAASRSRVKVLEAKLAQRQQAQSSAASWSSRAAANQVVVRQEVTGPSCSARDLMLLPGVESRRAGAAPAAAASAETSSEPALASLSSRTGGELERALDAVRRQQQPTSSSAASAATVGTPGASAFGAAPSTAVSPWEGEVSEAAASTTAAASATVTPRVAVPRAAAPPRAAKARSECMAHRRRLEATYTAMSSPTKPAAAAGAGRPRGGAPRQRYLNAFHGHSPDFQSIAKAAICESSDDEQGGDRARPEDQG